MVVLHIAGSHTPANLGVVGPDAVGVNTGVKFSLSYGEAAQDSVWLEAVARTLPSRCLLIMWESHRSRGLSGVHLMKRRKFTVRYFLILEG